MNPKSLLCSLVASFAAVAAAPATAETNWPTKPVKILFGFPPASATDVIARAVGQKLQDKWLHDLLRHGGERDQRVALLQAEL
jgi:tripartite-type tricarboxylate transporter receptor subunit TctC